MSEFTGKCDFCDTFSMGNADDFIDDRSSISINDCKLNIKDKKDLYQFFPFLVASMSCTKIDDHRIYRINLAKEPYWDSEERESLSFHVWEYFCVFDKWSRKKSEENLFDFWKKQKKDLYYNEEAFKKIIDIFSKFPKKEIKALSVLANDKSNPILRNKMLEVLVDLYLYNVHLPQYQKQRKKFIDWYKQYKYPSTQVVQSIEFKLGAGF